MEKPNFENFDRIVFVVTKEYIDNGDFENVLGFLNSLLEDSIKHENKIMLTIDGYNFDSRELYMIPEIRDYFAILDKLFPYWFFFMIKTEDKRYSSLVLIMLLLVPLEIQEEIDGVNKIVYNIERFNEFMNLHFHYLNELTDNIGLLEDENKRISAEVFKAFE